MPARLLPAERVRIGGVPIDRLTMDQAVDAIEELVLAGRGGSVFTPNVDHIVQCQSNPPLRRAYEAASLSLADGAPVVWASALLRQAVPEKVSGSDLVRPLARRAAMRRWRVLLLGGGDGIARRAAARMSADAPGLDVVGVLSPRVDLREPVERRRWIVEEVRRAAPHLVLVALGAPKQEIWIHESRDPLAPTVLLGIGATLDFLAGAVPRAPAWMSRHGLEWLYRLAREPRRLWRRYLIQDPRFLGVLVRDLHARYGPGARSSAVADRLARDGEHLARPNGPGREHDRDIDESVEQQASLAEGGRQPVE
jgi:N-acetylglucosaminyldiphosphoundecaprenol N-acetyl-beta-D-mannosaminyltransferase